MKALESRDLNYSAQKEGKLKPPIGCRGIGRSEGQGAGERNALSSKAEGEDCPGLIETRRTKEAQEKGSGNRLCRRKNLSTPEGSMGKDWRSRSDGKMRENIIPS